MRRPALSSRTSSQPRVLCWMDGFTSSSAFCLAKNACRNYINHFSLSSAHSIPCRNQSKTREKNFFFIIERQALPLRDTRCLRRPSRLARCYSQRSARRCPCSQLRPSIAWLARRHVVPSRAQPPGTNSRPIALPLFSLPESLPRQIHLFSVF